MAVSGGHEAMEWTAWKKGGSSIPGMEAGGGF